MPVKISLETLFKVSYGYPRTDIMNICCDSITATAPIHSNSNTNRFAQLNADFSQIPKHELKKLIRKEPDGEEYYSFGGTVEATFEAASMEHAFAMEGEFYLLSLLSSTAQNYLGVRYDVIFIKYT